MSTRRGHKKQKRERLLVNARYVAKKLIAASKDNPFNFSNFGLLIPKGAVVNYEPGSLKFDDLKKTIETLRRKQPPPQKYYWAELNEIIHENEYPQTQAQEREEAPQ